MMCFGNNEGEAPMATRSGPGVQIQVQVKEKNKNKYMNYFKIYLFYYIFISLYGSGRMHVFLNWFVTGIISGIGEVERVRQVCF